MLDHVRRHVCIGQRRSQYCNLLAKVNDMAVVASWLPEVTGNTCVGRSCVSFHDADMIAKVIGIVVIATHWQRLMT